MSKILILGCSFSIASYTLREYNSSANSEEGGDYAAEDIDFEYCYYDEWGRDYTVYAHPGGGIMAYGQCLQWLTKNNKLSDYSAIFIQEGFTPRITIQFDFNYMEHRNNIWGWVIDPIFHTKIGSMHKTQKRISEHFGFDWQQGISDWFRHLNHDDSEWQYLNQASASHLDRLAENTGIPTYSWSLTGIKYPHKYIKYLKVKSAYDTLWYKKKYHNFVNDAPYHLTHQGNRELGLMLKRGLNSELS